MISLKGGWFALLALLLPLTANGAIYKCVIDGQKVYQSQPCPPEADKAKDVSHLGKSSRMYSDSSSESYRYRDDVPAEKIYRERKQELQRQRYLRERELDRLEKRQQRAEARAEAQRQLERERLAKERRDREWREEQIRRKARRNDDYEYIDIRVR